MKYSQTTIKELLRQYRCVLKKCLLLNAIACGLFMAVPVHAELTIEEVRADASIEQTVNPKTQLDAYKYVVNGEEFVPTSGDASSFKFYLGDSETNLGETNSLDNSQYVFESSTGTSYDATQSSTIDLSQYGNGLTESDLVAGATLDKAEYEWKDGATLADGAPDISSYTFSDKDGNTHTIHFLFRETEILSIQKTCSMMRRLEIMQMMH